MRRYPLHRKWNRAHRYVTATKSRATLLRLPARLSLFALARRQSLVLTMLFPKASPPTSAASLSCFATARTSVPASWPRKEYVPSLPPVPYWRVANNSALKLGTFGRAKKKVDELQRVIAESRRTAH